MAGSIYGRLIVAVHLYSQRAYLGEFAGLLVDFYEDSALCVHAVEFAFRVRCDSVDVGEHREIGNFGHAYGLTVVYAQTPGVFLVGIGSEYTVNFSSANE